MILNWLLCCPSRGATTPAVAMSSTRWRTAGFLPTTSGAWWRSSMRFSTSAVWKRPSSTLRKALTDFWTLCPEVHIRPKASTFVVLAFAMFQHILSLYGRDFMQAQVKYESEIKTAVLGDRTITVKNLTPVFSPQELEKHNREIERRLFDVFRKYAGQRG